MTWDDIENGESGASVRAKLNALGAVVADTTASPTVATLPAGEAGDRAFVSDATAPAFGVAVVGGGAVFTPVFYNGAAWIVG